MDASITTLLSAIHFAADKHRDQRRKDCQQTPYINHPIEVAHLLRTVGGIDDLDLIVAAVLHDTVEDTEASLEEVAEMFGSRVAGIVAEVSDDKSLPQQRRKQLQIETAPHKSAEAKQLKLADKISNISGIDKDCPANWDHERKVKYVAWGKQVIAGCRGANAALEALFDETVAKASDRLSS